MPRKLRLEFPGAMYHACSAVAFLVWQRRQRPSGSQTWLVIAGAIQSDLMDGYYVELPVSSRQIRSNRTPFFAQKSVHNSKQIRCFWVIAFLLAIGAGAGVLLLQFVVQNGTVSPVTYKGDPLSVVFYGGRTNFFYETREGEAQEAINALGTNAFPFLISNLKAKTGNGAIYFKLYKAMPKWFQNRLPFPISGDDLKFVTFRHNENA